MSSRRLMSLLAMLLATLGLAALPAGALAQDDAYDDEIELVEDGWCDDDEELETRQADDESEFADEDDPDFLGPDDEEDVDDELSDDELSDDELSDEELLDDELLDDCDEPIAETLGAVGHIVVPDATRTIRRGVVTAHLYVPGRGRIDSVLTRGAGKGRASAGRGAVLGRAHQKVAAAGRVAITIKLTKRGRKAVRRADGELPLTLTAKVKLATGKKVTRVVHLTS